MNWVITILSALVLLVGIPQVIGWWHTRRAIAPITWRITRIDFSRGEIQDLTQMLRHYDYKFCRPCKVWLVLCIAVLAAVFFLVTDREMTKWFFIGAGVWLILNALRGKSYRAEFIEGYYAFVETDPNYKGRLIKTKKRRDTKEEAKFRAAVRLMSEEERSAYLNGMTVDEYIKAENERWGKM